MFSSNTFANINMLDKAADASYVRQNVLAHNLANVDTPTYKRSDVDFEGVLRRALKNTHTNDAVIAVRRLDNSKLKPKVYEDMSNFSYRLDRNNVDVDTESMEIASEQLRYQLITTGINNAVGRFKIVTGS